MPKEPKIWRKFPPSLKIAAILYFYVANVLWWKHGQKVICMPNLVLVWQFERLFHLSAPLLQGPGAKPVRGLGLCPQARFQCKFQAEILRFYSGPHNGWDKHFQIRYSRETRCGFESAQHDQKHRTEWDAMWKLPQFMVNGKFKISLRSWSLMPNCQTIVFAATGLWTMSNLTRLAADIQRFFQTVIVVYTLHKKKKRERVNTYMLYNTAVHTGLSINITRPI